MERYKKKDIFDEIVQLGYNGGSTQAYSYINKIKLKYGLIPFNNAGIQQRIIPYIKPLSSRKLVKYIGKSLSDIEDTDERIYMKALIDNVPELQMYGRAGFEQLWRKVIRSQTR